MNVSKRGKLIILSAPSGSGKTTLAKHILTSVENISFSISACSRKPRNGEVNGVDYYFLSVVEFQEKIAAKAFVEWEEVYQDHYYGTLKTEVERIRNKGIHVLFDVDVNGGLNIKKQYGDEALALFIKPPSPEVLAKRLSSRSSDSVKSIKTRLDKASHELSFQDRFDVIIINDDLEKTKKEIYNIVFNFLS